MIKLQIGLARFSKMSPEKKLPLPPQMEMICLEVSLLIFYRQHWCSDIFWI